MCPRRTLALAGCLLTACAAGTVPPPPSRATVSPATVSPATVSPATVSPAAAPAAPTVDVADLVTADATGIARYAPGNIALLAAVETLFAPAPPCWTRLVGQVRAAYQIEVGPGAAYHVFEGALPQDEIEACAKELRGLEAYVHQDGLVVEFIVRGGRFYAAWRGPLVIVASRRPLVEAAVAVRSPALARTWHDRLAALRPTPMTAWRSDALVANLVGVPTVAYQISIDVVGADPPRLAGAVVAQFAHPEAAALAAERLRAGAWGSPLAPPPEVATALTRLRVTVRGAELEARFDERTFDGVDVAVLSAWVAQLSPGP